MLSVRAICIASALAVTALAACGGGGGGGSTTPANPGGGTGSSATPTPGPMTASPQPLNLLTIGEAAPFTVSDPNYIGPITETDTCSGITTIDPTSGQGPTAVFNVTADAAGTCAYTMHDTFGDSFVEQIVVTTTSGSVQGAHRK